MTRTLAQVLRSLTDVLVLSLAYWAAFFVRFDGVPPFNMVKLLMFTWGYVIGLELFTLYAFSVPSIAWRYIGLRDMKRIGAAVAASSAVLLTLRLVAPAAVQAFPHATYALVPIGVMAVNAVLSFLGITGVRVLRRLLHERAKSRNIGTVQSKIPTLLVGSGQAGVMVAKEIAGRPDVPFFPVGFLDDDPTKLGTIVHGIRVLGSVDQVAELSERTGARQAIITMASATGSQIRRIRDLCSQSGIPTKIIPGVYEILHGHVNLSRIREVSIEDLLGRDAVTLDVERISEFLHGKRVLITGAGGSIGSELCRQVARFEPKTLCLVEQAEFNLFTIHQELRASFPEQDLRPLICDICDTARVNGVFDAEMPEVVFHAAAHKHVPMMEWNPGEAIKNNVFGTKKVADAAARIGSDAFVMISTDKAVNPTSIMGASKRAAEIYIQALSQHASTNFVAVRFGNVLGSAGSVIPIFKAQIEAGGPVMVTHPEMIRHFMTIPEASQLVMQAATMGNSGEILLLDMGEPVRIVDLAEELIRLSGLTPGVDIEIEFSGIRPGEKLFEELSFDAEKMTKTSHEKIFVGKLSAGEFARVDTHVDSLADVTGSTSSEEVRAALRCMVPELQEPSQDPLPSGAPSAASDRQGNASPIPAQIAHAH